MILSIKWRQFEVVPLFIKWKFLERVYYLITIRMPNGNLMHHIFLQAGYKLESLKQLFLFDSVSFTSPLFQSLCFSLSTKLGVILSESLPKTKGLLKSTVDRCYINYSSPLPVTQPSPFICFYFTYFQVAWFAVSATRLCIHSFTFSKWQRICVCAYKKKLALFTNYRSVVGVGSPCGSDGKASACNSGHLGVIPGSRRSPGGMNGNPF